MQNIQQVIEEISKKPWFWFADRNTVMGVLQKRSSQEGVCVVRQTTQPPPFVCTISWLNQGKANHALVKWDSNKGQFAIDDSKNKTEAFYPSVDDILCKFKLNPLMYNLFLSGKLAESNKTYYEQDALNESISFVSPPEPTTLIPVCPPVFAQLFQNMKQIISENFDQTAILTEFEQQNVTPFSIKYLSEVDINELELDISLKEAMKKALVKMQ